MINYTSATGIMKEVLDAIGAVAIGYTVAIGGVHVGNDVGYGVGIGVIAGVPGAPLKVGLSSRLRPKRSSGSARPSRTMRKGLQPGAEEASVHPTPVNDLYLEHVLARDA